MDLGSGPLESFNPLPAGELIRSLWMLFGMALPICSTSSQPAATTECLQEIPNLVTHLAKVAGARL